MLLIVVFSFALFSTQTTTVNVKGYVYTQAPFCGNTVPHDGPVTVWALFNHVPLIANDGVANNGHYQVPFTINEQNPPSQFKLEVMNWAGQLKSATVPYEGGNTVIINLQLGDPPRPPRDWDILLPPIFPPKN
jgi:hypothetical protein